MAAPQHLILDPEILAAIVRTRIEHRCNKSKRHRVRVEALRRDNPFLKPTPTELLPWRKPMRVKKKREDRSTTLAAALVWAMLVGFVAVAYACQS